MSARIQDLIFHACMNDVFSLWDIDWDKRIFTGCINHHILETIRVPLGEVCSAGEALLHEVWQNGLNVLPVPRPVCGWSHTASQRREPGEKCSGDHQESIHMKSVKQLLSIIKLLSTDLSHTPKRTKKEEEMSGSTRSEDISSMVKMNGVLFFQM